jgi:hypothetical protein
LSKVLEGCTLFQNLLAKFEARAIEYAKLELASGVFPKLTNTRDLRWLIRNLDLHAQQKLPQNRLQILEANGLYLSDFDGQDLTPYRYVPGNRYRRPLGEPIVTEQEVKDNIHSYGPIPIDSKAFQTDAQAFQRKVQGFEKTRNGHTGTKFKGKITSADFPSLAHIIEACLLHWDEETLELYLKFYDPKMGVFDLHADTRPKGHTTHKPHNMFRRFITTIGGGSNQTKQISFVRVGKDIQNRITKKDILSYNCPHGTAIDMNEIANGMHDNTVRHQVEGAHGCAIFVISGRLTTSTTIEKFHEHVMDLASKAEVQNDASTVVAPEFGLASPPKRSLESPPMTVMGRMTSSLTTTRGTTVMRSRLAIVLVLTTVTMKTTLKTSTVTMKSSLKTVTMKSSL